MSKHKRSASENMINAQCGMALGIMKKNKNNNK